MSDYRPGTVAKWLKWHSVRSHVVAPLWLRISEKRRWAVVHWLNKSHRFCWADLVSAALAVSEVDACDVSIPSMRGDRVTGCAAVCGLSHPSHSGRHACSCYCGKFEFTAPDGALERRSS